MAPAVSEVSHDPKSPNPKSPNDESPDSASSRAEGVVEDGSRTRGGWFIAGLAVVIAGGVTTRVLTERAPARVPEGNVQEFVAAIEYPVYAIILGLSLNWVLSAAGLRDRLAGGFRTEFFIKTGLVLLGATVLLGVIVRAAGPAIIQAILLISGVFFFAWWVGGLFGLDNRLRALLASAVSICGVSAAIAAAGAVRAKKEHLAYTASLVILFALPSIFLLPWLADLMGLSPAVTGAWIGGNIDTTAAVTAAGAVAGEEPLQIATVVKLTQNALIGVVAVALTAFFTFKVDRKPDAGGPKLAEFWQRFPKFVLGFLAASVIATIAVESVSTATFENFDAVVKTLRDYFLILAFVSIGLEFKVTSLRDAGSRPVGVFALATVFNVVLALALASVLFRSFTF